MIENNLTSKNESCNNNSNSKKTFYLFSTDLILLIINYLLQKHQIIYGSGSNEHWNLGIPNDNNKKSVKLSWIKEQNIEIKQISMAYEFTVFLTFSGEIFICGKHENVINSKKPILINYFKDNKIKISMISNFTPDTNHLLLLDASDGAALYGWGKYDPLSLPFINETNNTITPKKIEYFKNINEKISQIYCNSDFTVILTNNSRLFINGTNHSFISLSKTSYNKEWNEILVDTTSNNNSQLLTISKITCGYYSIFILMSDGTVFSAGSNNWGQLGDNTSYTTKHSDSLKIMNWFIKNNIKIFDIKSGAYHCIALSQSKKIYTWRDNEWAQIGNGESIIWPPVLEQFEVKLNINPNRIKSIIAGHSSNIVLIDQNTNDNIIAFAWGSNEELQLNLCNNETNVLSNEANIKDAQAIVTAKLKSIENIWCGYKNMISMYN